MLINGSQLIGTPIMGLQTGTELARIKSPIINPHNLSILAYEVEGPLLDQQPSLLRIADVREMSDIGMIIDSSDEFVQPDDIIKLKDIYEMNFSLIDKHVVNDKRAKMGKVIDYTIDIESFIIQQINIKRPLFRSFTDDELLVHRSQIIEITDTTIVIKTGAENARPAIKASPNYVNPFRQNTPQAEGLDITK